MSSLQAKFADPAAWRETGKPGDATFEYANLGAPLVATVLEAASGERYDRLVERLVFAPLGIKACLNWLGCDAAMQARAVTLYRHTGEVAVDAPERLPPACTVPVAEGTACDLADYVPGTNASIFSPQGGVRIGMMDLAKIGQALFDLQYGDTDGFLAPNTAQLAMWTLAKGETGDETFFCTYGLHLQLIEAPGRTFSDDKLFGDGIPRMGHSGEAYGLQSGLWTDPKGDTGFVYFTTQVPPPAGGEDTGGFTPREQALMARAQALLSDGGN